jgi:transcriptional regulator with XRE-family HTH domain
MIDTMRREEAEMARRNVLLIPRLFHFRLERGLTVAELAEQSGVNRQTIARIESGKPASVPTVYRLAKALGITVDELRREAE